MAKNDYPVIVYQILDERCTIFSGSFKGKEVKNMEEQELTKTEIEKFMYEEMVIDGKTKEEAVDKLFRVLGITIPEIKKKE